MGVLFIGVFVKDVSAAPYVQDILDKITNQYDIRPSNETKGSKIILKDFPQKTPEGLQYCRDSLLNLRFFCNTQWLRKYGMNFVFLVVSNEPAAAITLGKINSDVKFINQLSRNMLTRMDRYQPGFAIEEVEINHIKALKIKAYAKQFPQMRLLDYYIVYNQQLYSMLFSVESKKHWDDYKFLFQKVAKSLEFAK